MLLNLNIAGLVTGLALAGATAAAAQEANSETQAPAGAAAAEAEAGNDADYDASTVVAVVDGTEITLGHVIAMRQRLPEEFQGLADETLMEGVIDQIVDQELLSRTLSESSENDPLSVKLHLENERRAALAQDAVQERVQVPVDDAQVQAAHDSLVESFQSQTEYNASHIIVPTQEEAAALKEEIEGGADFAEVAKEHSQDGAAGQGGSLGWFGPGQMVPEFETAVSEMEPGEVRGPVQTQFGWHLIKLNETRQTEPPALDAVRERLTDQVRQERLTEEVQSLRDAAEIERTDTGIPPRAVRDDTLLEN